MQKELEDLKAQLQGEDANVDERKTLNEDKKKRLQNIKEIEDEQDKCLDGVKTSMSPFSKEPVTNESAKRAMEVKIYVT